MINDSGLPVLPLSVLPRKIYAKLIIEAAQKLSSLQEFADLSICAATRDCFF